MSSKRRKPKYKQSLKEKTNSSVVFQGCRLSIILRTYRNPQNFLKLFYFLSGHALAMTSLVVLTWEFWRRTNPKLSSGRAPLSIWAKSIRELIILSFLNPHHKFMWQTRTLIKTTRSDGETEFTTAIPRVECLPEEVRECTRRGESRERETILPGDL